MMSSISCSNWDDGDEQAIDSFTENQFDFLVHKIITVNVQNRN
jgi:hypothetical protein